MCVDGQCDARFGRLEQGMVRVETQMEHVEKTINKMDSTLDKVHVAVTSNSASMAWTKRIIFILLTAMIGGGSIAGVVGALEDGDKASVVVESVDTPEKP